MGIDVVTFQYQVVFVYGGQYQGKGQYLAQIDLKPKHLDVLWGFTFKANGKVSALFNTGTKESPIAAATLSLQWSVENPLQSQHSTVQFFVNGKGEFQRLE
jgi:hypothetical protein